jgi:hypothetical protein
MRRLILAVALAAAIAPSLAFAQTNTPVIDRRELRQQGRIAAGIGDGSLTAPEAARLERGEAHIDAMENRAAADGVVTPGERARIREQENVESWRIYRQRHDGQTQ